jgi:hypothetical protein
MANTTDLQICDRFESGLRDLESMIAPLAEIVHESKTLIMGYGTPRSGERRSMIPYFHVCGAYADHEPVRILLVGGWLGDEAVTPFALVRLLVALEARLHLAAGIEVTAFPVANLEAHRKGTPLGPGQHPDQLRCWIDSPHDHIGVLERELNRYAYDLAIVMREDAERPETTVDLWAPEDERRAILSSALDAHAATDTGFRWQHHAFESEANRIFTPIPHSMHQPAEATITLSSKPPVRRRCDEAIVLALILAHALRDSRAAQAAQCS